MALLPRSYHGILQFLPISCQDLTKISMEGRPGQSIAFQRNFDEIILVVEGNYQIFNRTI